MTDKGPMSKAVEIARGRVMRNIEIIATQFGYKGSEGTNNSPNCWIDVCSNKELQDNVWKPMKSDFEDETPVKDDTIYLFNESLVCESKYQVSNVVEESDSFSIELIAEEYTPKVSMDTLIQEEGISYDLKKNLIEKFYPQKEKTLEKTEYNPETNTVLEGVAEEEKQDLGN